MKKVELLRRIKGLLALLFGVGLVSLMAFSPSKYNAEGDWTVLTQQNGITISAMESTCEKSDVYLFKIENTTRNSVQLTYTLTATLDPTFPPITKHISLDAQSSVSGNCNTLWETALPNSHKAKGNLKDRLEATLSINQ